MDKSLKDEQKKAWGSLDALGSIDAILRTCESLNKEGQSINRDTVRQRSGVGFNNLVAAGIRVYRAHQNDFHKYPDVPKVLFPVIMEALSQVHGEIKADLDKQQKERTQNLELALRESSVEYAKLENQFLQLQNTKDRINERLLCEQDKLFKMQTIVDSKHI